MRVTFCVPGRHYPGDKTVLARVIDDYGREQQFRFAADIRLDRAAWLVDTLWREEVEGKKRKVKAV